MPTDRSVNRAQLRERTDGNVLSDLTPSPPQGWD